MADINDAKTACAKSALCHSRHNTSLAEKGSILVSYDAGYGDGAAEDIFGRFTIIPHGRTDIRHRYCG